LGYNRKSLQDKKILITCGPTWVRIDPVRVISNISSGELAHEIAKRLTSEKASVTLLEGPVTHRSSGIANKTLSFKYFDELEKLLKQHLRRSHYDIVIHAAAVSDYQIKNALSKKIKSNLPRLCLCLTKTPKLISQIKKIDSEIFLVGFKLETNASQKMLLQKTKNLIKEAKCDLVIANTLNKNNYRACIIDRAGNVLSRATSRKKIAQNLIAALKENL
jgi:phosphopantothenoylcysteine decarboxylase/phosphopantothenate--cysteine ligase